MSNPLLAPIHGINLQDYAAICAKIASGIDEQQVLKAMGIDKPIFDEINTLWPARMQEDGTFEVSIKFGQYFGEVDSHPILGNVKAEMSDEANAYLAQFKTDRYFYEELNGARQAAYDYGYDGAQWIQDNFGISLGDFQKIAMQWMEVYRREMLDDNGEGTLVYTRHQEQKYKAYADKFAKEQDGNIADDIEF